MVSKPYQRDIKMIKLNNLKVTNVVFQCLYDMNMLPSEIMEAYTARLLHDYILIKFQLRVKLIGF